MDDHGDYQEVIAEKTINRKLHQKIKRKGIGTTDWIEARKFNKKKLWVVQRVIDRKKEGGIIKYLCKFQNFGSWWNEWLTRENFLIPDMLNEYDENDDDDDDQQPRPDSSPRRTRSMASTSGSDEDPTSSPVAGPSGCTSGEAGPNGRTSGVARRIPTIVVPPKTNRLTTTRFSGSKTRRPPQ